MVGQEGYHRSVKMVCKLVGTILMMLTASLSFIHTARTAEISCITTWSFLGEYHAADLVKWYPSGRRPSPTTCVEALVKGEIVSGDSERFASLWRANHPFLHRVTLWSPGGSAEEAMKICRLVRKAMLLTRAPDGSPDYGINSLFSDGLEQICKGPECYCASACFLIWSAGIERDGWSIGLHRPSIESTSFGNLPALQASRMYRSLLGDINSYLAEMEIPQSLIDEMTSTSSAGIRWLKLEEFESLEEAPSIAEWITASCGGTLKSNLKWRLFNEHRADDDKVFDCQQQKINKSRDAIN